MQLVANVDGDSFNSVDASWRRDAPCRRWRCSTSAVTFEREEGVFEASGRRCWIVLSMMHLFLLVVDMAARRH